MKHKQCVQCTFEHTYSNTKHSHTSFEHCIISTQDQLRKVNHIKLSELPPTIGGSSTSIRPYVFNFFDYKCFLQLLQVKCRSFTASAQVSWNQFSYVSHIIHRIFILIRTIESASTHSAEAFSFASTACAFSSVALLDHRLFQPACSKLHNHFSSSVS